MPLPPGFDPSVLLRPPRRLSWSPWRIAALAGGAFFVIAICLQLFFFRAPGSFAAGTTVVVRPGWGVSNTAAALREGGVIRSEFFFKAFMVLFGGKDSIIAGRHRFDAPENVISIAWRFSHDNQEFALVRLTIPEGTTIRGITRLMPKEFSLFDPKEFLKLAAGKEGYLFPDTYYLSSDVGAAEIYRVLTENFTKKTADAKAESAKLGRKFSEVLTIASILEAEAADDASRRIISGIIQRRLKLGMALQVDATLRYWTGRGSADLTDEDLKADSPYNTYTRVGLPPTPINNPGLAAIDAALHPKATNYLFFVSDKNGKMHYAATIEEHVANVQKYLP